jgi:hypothetical protein
MSENKIYESADPRDYRLIDALETLIWTLRNPSKVDHVWHLKAFEDVENNLEYSKYKTKAKLI